MSIFIMFNDGSYSQFDECDSIDFTYGTIAILEDNLSFVYAEDEIKEMIFVNDSTLPYAIQQGYEL